MPLTHGRDGDDVVLLNGDDDDDDGDKDDDDYPCSSDISHLLLTHDTGDGDGCDGCVNETMKVIGTNELTNNLNHHIQMFSPGRAMQCITKRTFNKRLMTTSDLTAQSSDSTDSQEI